MVVASALAFHLIARPYLSAITDLRSAVAREQDLLRREQELLAEVKAYPVRLQHAERTLLRQAPRLFAGPDLVAASAALSNYVSGKAHGARVFVQHSETRSPSAGDGVARLQLDLSAVGDLEGFLAFLQALESGSKLVTVNQLAIGQAQRVNAAQSRDEEVLTFSATMSGYALTDPTTEAP
jgi:Tfp pilus assembly protein PilO